MRISDWSSDVCSSDLTDSKFTALDDQFQQLSDNLGARLSEQDERIDRMGAMSSAMMNMAMNAAGGRSERGRVAVGAGWQNGESALSVGYSKQIGERGSFSIGGAFSNGDNSAGIGFGRSEAHTSELQSLMRISYAVFCL